MQAPDGGDAGDTVDAVGPVDASPPQTADDYVGRYQGLVALTPLDGNPGDMTSNNPDNFSISLEDGGAGVTFQVIAPDIIYCPGHAQIDSSGTLVLVAPSMCTNMNAAGDQFACILNSGSGQRTVTGTVRSLQLHFDWTCQKNTLPPVHWTGDLTAREQG